MGRGDGGVGGGYECVLGACRGHTDPRRLPPDAAAAAAGMVVVWEGINAGLSPSPCLFAPTSPPPQPPTFLHPRLSILTCIPWSLPLPSYLYIPFSSFPFLSSYYIQLCRFVFFIPVPLFTPLLSPPWPSYPPHLHPSVPLSSAAASLLPLS